MSRDAFCNITSLFGIIAALALAGCGGGAEGNPDRPTTHPVTGVVTLDGNPVPNAQVTFVSKAGGDAANSAFGRADAEGRYTLTTFDSGDGAVAGGYLVTVTKYDSPPPQEEPEEVSMENYVPPGAAGSEPEEPPKNELPAKYADRQTTDLNVTVKEGENEIPLELSE